MLKIIYLCTHNRCRSIIAEAVTNMLNDDRVIAVSAGSQPAGAVHPLTLTYLQKRGIDISQSRSKSWHEHESFKPNIAITLCDNAADEACPSWLDDSDNVVRVHWGLRDPSSINNNLDSSTKQVEQAFNQTIDIIQTRVEALLAGEMPTIKEKHQLSATLNDLALRYREPVSQAL